MTLEMLVHEFIRVKQAPPSNADELLDFTQRCYILGNLSIAQYQNLFRELNLQGASKPEYA
ncbi:YppF family protein [Ammoniphilus sp. YIM 78166]|uniref:YppF family protein n=1 Tax=Ammoniphilus sp. YIM 78166 TaxID=1644106 RepID=UPI001431ADA5|nr:YppF family protein [Ammoniphilus sp. YIM 78166]